MKKYLAFFRLRFIAGLQYRSAAWAGVATQFVWGFMSILLFRAFYGSDPSAFPMEFQSLSGYIWLQQALLGLFMSWFYDGEILEAVSSGSVAYELCRPADVYSMWFTKNLAVRFSRTVLRCVPILLVAAFLPSPYGISAPSSVPAFLLFLVSTLLGTSVLTAFAMIVYISSFYTVTTIGVRTVAVSMTELFAGALIPLPFFPDAVRRVVDLLPFASIQSTPLLIYVGEISGADALYRMGLQAAWLVILTVFGVLWMKRSLRRVVVQGG